MVQEEQEVNVLMILSDEELNEILAGKEVVHTFFHVGKVCVRKK